MKILVLGGTRFFGVHTINALLEKGHDVTVATRGNIVDSFENKVSHIFLDRTDSQSLRKELLGKHFDVVIDKIAYCSNDIKKLLDFIDCDIYISMSSTAIYHPKHWNTVEEDFDVYEKNVIWCDRQDFPYEEVKRQAEYAIAQCYKEKKSVCIRYPFVIGKDDYTKRLLFYVEHIMQEKPMYINDLNNQMSFIDSKEAGQFIAFLVDCNQNKIFHEKQDYFTAYNGASHGTISIREIIAYVERKTGKKSILSDDGDIAPFNNEPEYMINVEKSEKLGFHFSDLKTWIYDLLDYYIDSIKK